MHVSLRSFSGTVVELIAALDALDKNTSSLDLSNINFSRFESSTIAKVFEHLPKHLESLNLSNCRLGKVPGVSLVAGLQHLSSNLLTLNLKGNSLYHQQEDFTAFFQALPSSLAEIDLGYNELFYCQTDRLQKLISAIILRPNIACLSLEANGLFNEIRFAFDNIIQNLNNLAKIPKLNLLYNDLEERNPFEAMLIAKTLREGRALTDVSYDKLSNLGEIGFFAHRPTPNGGGFHWQKHPSKM